MCVLSDSLNRKMIHPLLLLVKESNSIAYLFWGLIFLAFSAQAQNLTCHPNDSRALLGGFSNNFWAADSSSNCCNWTGISCDPNTGRVVKLELSNQKLTGNISDSLSYLDHLNALNLSTNSLSGHIPWSLFTLPELQHLDLSSNDISGTIPPEIGNCSSLEKLLLSSNNLVGDVPRSIFWLSNLSQLSLSDNRLTGQLSNGFGNLSKLVYLDVSWNWFSGDIPDVFHKFAKLQDFSAQSNNFTGGIPNSLSNLSNLNSLVLRNNSLSGKIDINCSAMTSLVSLDLATNLFTGPFPDNLPFCTQLKTLNLAKNDFNSEIPESFGNFHSLRHLSLSNATLHNLSSALQILQHCRNLTTLVLTLNFHDEVMPSSDDDRNSILQFENLKTLIIANCRLTGSVPNWLSSSTQLQLLDLSWNYLNGTIPPWLGNFKFLFYVDLSNNSFTGEIPKSFTQLESLVNKNRSLEDTVLDFPFFLRRNTSLKGLQYNRVTSFPPTLEFGHNFLSGPIWAEFGNLSNLHVLDLKCNNLSGKIPSALSGMKSIEMLDLSHNDLSGDIPSSLVSLSFLSQFSVAYNNLVGVIPNGGQFVTFPNSSFEGNNDLCGNHAPACPTNELIPPPSSSHKSSSRKSVVVGLGIGIGIGSIFLLCLGFVLVFRTCTSSRVVDTEKDEPEANGEGESEEHRSRLVVLFRNNKVKEELSVDDLLKSTNNFDEANIIGCGGFGLVYKATLFDGTKLAVKRLSNECGQMEREFRAEVETLSRAEHPNLVLLQGYCSYKKDRLLIYTYMEKGSLDYWLHEKNDGFCFLDWETRLRIAQGSARALAYLHQSCEPRILHRDIKSSNILLDEKFEAYLADFGLARLILPYDTHVSTDLVGTLGYIPPEYSQASVASYKGDIYSFGVVLLEILSGRRPMDMCKPKGTRDLISWVFQMKRDKKESEVFDPFVYDKQNSKEMMRVLEIACLCLCDCPKLRPSTQQLVYWLDHVI